MKFQSEKKLINLKGVTFSIIEFFNQVLILFKISLFFRLKINKGVF